MEHLLLLHGALGAKEQLESLAEKLSGTYKVHLLNFNGHGGNPFLSENFSIPAFGHEVLKYLGDHAITSVSIFGYSMGGYVGMWLGKYYPGKIRKLITLATKFYWDEQVAAKEIRMLDADTIQLKVPAFAKQLEQRHAPNDWRQLVGQTRELLKSLGEENALKLADYSTIETPCLLLLGDKDKMITKRETEDVCSLLPNATLTLMPDTVHPIEQVNEAAMVKLIREFLQ